MSVLKLQNDTFNIYDRVSPIYKIHNRSILIIPGKVKYTMPTLMCCWNKTKPAGRANKRHKYNQRFT